MTLDHLRVDKLTLNSTTPVINLLVAVTDYVFEFSESVVATITLYEEPIQRVTLDPASAVINVDGWFVMHNKFNNVYIAVNKNCTALIIGFSNTKYIRNISAQCEQLLHEAIQHSIIFIMNVCFSS